MFFSIVIPLYNKEKYILKTIESVLKQTHQDFELIIVDDGSTDNSLNLIDAIKDKRIRIIGQENGGVSKARNTGVKMAKSEWVAFLDADDEYLPEFLYEVEKFILEHRSYNLSFVGANYYLGRNKKIAINDIKISGKISYFRHFRNNRSPNNSSTTVVRKDKFLEVGGFPEGIKQFEDWIAWMKLAFVGDFGYISKPLGIYNYVEDSVANSNRNCRDFFNDASLLPKTICRFMRQYEIKKQKIKLINNVISDFSINIALILSKQGCKVLALKMIKFANIKNIIKHKKLSKLIVSLFLPNYLTKLLKIN